LLTFSLWKIEAFLEKKSNVFPQKTVLKQFFTEKKKEKKVLMEHFQPAVIIVHT